jgi:hypothetical protein
MSNILVIVEGNKTEPMFFEQLHKVYGLDYTIFCLSTNIYTLYRRVKELDFECDIKQVLKAIHPEKAEMLSNKFAYTYLVFDCDAHHPKKEETRSIEQIISENLDKIAELVTYFNDETDPARGKLYINYPMVESYKDADNFFEDDFQNRTVGISDLANYKAIVAKRKLSNKRVDSITKDEFSKLTKMNLYKLNKIVNNLWDKMPYDVYLETSNAVELFKAERTFVESERSISVINTTLFIVIDYFGNQHGFYDEIIENNNDE